MKLYNQIVLILFCSQVVGSDDKESNVVIDKATSILSRVKKATTAEASVISKLFGSKRRFG